MRVFLHAATVLLLLPPALASAQSFSKAQKHLGDRDYPEAAKEYLLLAETGHSSAQSVVADFYYQGKGVPQDFAEAAKWYLRAAEQGNTYAQTSLGTLYGKGEGLPQSDTEAMKWLTRAAKAGYLPAQSGLGAFLIQAPGDLQDMVAAHVWLNIAAANGSVEAASLRDGVAGVLTSTQVKEAQERARRCLASEYQTCD